MSLLIGNVWNAHTDWYDYINCIDLVYDELVTGGGQWVNMECGVTVTISPKVVPYKEPPIYDYERSVLVEEGEIKFKYKEKDSCWDACPEFDPRIDFRCIKYKLYRGNFIFAGPLQGMCQRWRYKLVLENSPMPQPQVCHFYLIMAGLSAWDLAPYYGVKIPEEKVNMTWYNKQIPRKRGMSDGKVNKYETLGFVYRRTCRYFPNEV